MNLDVLYFFLERLHCFYLTLLSRVTIRVELKAEQRSLLFSCLRGECGSKYQDLTETWSSLIPIKFKSFSLYIPVTWEKSRALTVTLLSTVTERGYLFWLLKDTAGSWRTELPSHHITKGYMASRNSLVSSSCGLRCSLNNSWFPNHLQCTQVTKRTDLGHDLEQLITVTW